MQQDRLDRAERELLGLIRQLHAAQGPLDPAALSVEAKGRGMELARPLARLKSLGLVEEVAERPGFLRRLFGARPAIRLRPAPGVEETPEAAVPPDPAPEAPPPRPDPAPPTPAPDIAAPAPNAEPDAEPHPEPAPAAEPVPQPAPAPAPVARAPAAPAPARLRPVPPTALTEDLGGAPMGRTALAMDLPPDLLEGLRDTLAAFGMDLTQAGEALVADRLARGASPGEALSQVVLFAFAHAVRHDLQSGGTVEALGLSHYAVEVMQEIEKLRDAGEIGETAFEADMRSLWDLVGSGSPEAARAAMAEALLADPAGGAAPPALLPEDLQSADEA
ncbi:hypothetical protein [Frigidibacter oleivorans]|uniref:hypothetical protein n=1 Tax=Frigidibacter oleivorans TaxID=2487129 RepID=UPI000F8D8453|nr:hypothetical protein [Frigidibacter oleivorans]